MATYAKLYGFQLFDSNGIKGKTRKFTFIGEGCFLSNSDFEMLEEILNNEF